MRLAHRSCISHANSDVAKPDPSHRNDRQYYRSSAAASFSSAGPSFDGRIKPDVVAPGYFTRSARADGATSSSLGGCSLTYMAGTSMATPAVAGMVALLRQYFRSGFHAYGTANASHALLPSASLLRAALVAASSTSRVRDRQRALTSAARVPLIPLPFANHPDGFGA